MSAGAYRGYGATQGIFAVESAVNELAQTLGMDPTVLREKNMVREGMAMPAYYGEIAKSCALDRCMARAKEMIGWDEKYPCRDMNTRSSVPRRRRRHGDAGIRNLPCGYRICGDQGK